jgi:hypothetical protein
MVFNKDGSITLERNGQSKDAPALKRGIYRTEYGNAAFVSGPRANSAYDLDMGEHVPMDCVTSELIRPAEDADEYAAEME